MRGPKVIPEDAIARQKAIDNERRYQQEQESLRRAQAIQDQKDLEERAAAERARLAASEQAKVTQAKTQEAAVIAEAKARKNKEPYAVDFYTALNKGMEASKVNPQ